MLRDTFIYAALLAVLILCSCAGSQPGKITDPAQEQIAGSGYGAPLILPDPATLRHTSFSEASLYRFGMEYADWLPFYHLELPAYLTYEDQHPTTFYNGIAFSPFDFATAPRAENLAYAIYDFNIAGYDRDQTIRLDGAKAGPELLVWVGLPDYDLGAWQWYPLPADGVIETDLPAHARPDGTLLVAVVAQTSYMLESLRIGEELAPEIHGVTPELKYNAYWDIAIDASHTWPVHISCSFKLNGQQRRFYLNKGFASSPVRIAEVLSEIGTYECELRLWNSAGEDVLTFPITVAEPIG